MPQRESPDGPGCGLGRRAVWGCGDDEGPGRHYPVHGRVMYRSQHMKIGQITVFSDSHGGVTHPDHSGRVYTLSRADHPAS